MTHLLGKYQPKIQQVQCGGYLCDFFNSYRLTIVQIYNKTEHALVNTVRNVGQKPLR